MVDHWPSVKFLLCGVIFIRSYLQKLGSFMEMLFGGRYVILLMALFSIYCGLIYNEFFSVPFHIFGGSAYRCRDTTCRYVLCFNLDLFYYFSTRCWCAYYFLSSDAYTTGLVKYRDPYPFGVDPSWRGSRTELPYLNSLKMKMSILLGIAQMNLGLILSFFNARFFGSSLDIRFVLSLFISSQASEIFQGWLMCFVMCH